MCEKIQFDICLVWQFFCLTVLFLNWFFCSFEMICLSLCFTNCMFSCVRKISVCQCYIFQVRGSEVLVQRVLLKRAQRNQVNEKKKSLSCEYGQCPFCLIWSFIEILRISWNSNNTRNFGHTHQLLHFVAFSKDWQSDLTFLLLEWQQENRTGSMSTVVFVVQTKDAFGNITQRRGSLLSYQPTRWSRQKVGL